MAAAENRAKKYMKETAWMKFERLNELSRHKWRIHHMKPSVDNEAPHLSPHMLINQKQADLEEVLGGASNWIGKYTKEPKKLCDARPWRSFSNKARGDPAPFSTLKLTPRGEGEESGHKGKKKEKDCKTGDCGKAKKNCPPCDDWLINCGNKLRVIERNNFEMKERVHWIHKNYSLYTPKKRKYLCRGEAPWKKPPRPTTVDEKLDQIRKWSMKHHSKKPSPQVESTSCFTIFRPAPPPPIDDGVASLSISAVTEEEAAKDPQLAQLKQVQEAGDPNF